jgi:hypothetical protein
MDSSIARKPLTTGESFWSESAALETERVILSNGCLMWEKAHWGQPAISVCAEYWR